MRRVVVDFSSATRDRWLGSGSSRPTNLAAMLFTAAALVGCCAVALHGFSVTAQLHESREHGADLQQRIDALNARLHKPVAKVPREQAAELNRITRHLNTPWATIFEVLERRTPQNVALLAIEPDASRQTVRLTAEARALEDLMHCAESLRADPAVRRILLIEHETNERDPTRPVRLTLELSLETPG